MVFGTASSVGKSLVATGFCRLLFRKGLRVAPFKAQNMALNSAVVRGGEIGRSQAVQAAACRLEADVRMNPVLLKPMTDRRAQVVVMGKALGNRSAARLFSSQTRNALWSKARTALRSLQKEYEVLVLEGAGSPAEPNLEKGDFVNLRSTRQAGAVAVLVGDISVGGVFAQLLGTLDLMPGNIRKRVCGLIVNRFRGDPCLFDEGVRFLEKKSGLPVLGVIPELFQINIPEEDDPATLGHLTRKGKRPIKIGVVALGHTSNFTDLEPFAVEPDVSLVPLKGRRWPKSLDILVIPGSKNPIADLRALRKQDADKKIIRMANRGTQIVGLCGGFQILGEVIEDPDRIETGGTEKGLGLLPVRTRLGKTKILKQTKGIHVQTRCSVQGYEIHHGRTSRKKNISSAVALSSGRKDGAVHPKMPVWGTYLHGIFDSDRFRRKFLNQVRRKKGLGPLANSHPYDMDREIDRWADHLEKHLNLKPVYRALGIS